MSLDHETALKRSFGEDSVREIHLLAQRLRSEMGELDDAAIEAVSETTGLPEEYVRLAIRSAPLEQKQSWIQRIKTSFLAFDPDLRRYAMSGVLATGTGLAIALSASTRDSSGFLGAVGLLGMVGALWNFAVCNSIKSAGISGALYGVLTFVVMTFCTFVFRFLPNFGANGPAAGYMLFWLFGSIISAILAQTIFAANRSRWGMKDPNRERRELLAQLQDIQQKLRSDERFVTFLSVDIVGSTRIKAESDPLTVEFTFNEYHLYVQTITEKFGGKVHSTAGDGVTCVFESPQMGYAAARAVLGGLFEFNAMKNKLSTPIVVRAGVHTGNAHVAGSSLTNVNFAHVIDIAAHMQKEAAPGSLAISESTANYLPGGLEGLGGAAMTVDGIRAASWQPRARVENLAPQPSV